MDNNGYADPVLNGTELIWLRSGYIDGKVRDTQPNSLTLNAIL